jgi:iron complex transport system substrate-binding protein
MPGPRTRRRGGTRGRLVLLLALVQVLALAGCSSGSASQGIGPTTTTTVTTGSATFPASAPSFPVTLTDDEGVVVTLKDAPQRIVTFAPSNTEIVFALGLGPKLVGVSGSFDDYPPEAKDIEQVGGAGQFGVDPNVETVVSLHPDLMLTIAGGEQWKQRLRDIGVPVFTVDAQTFDDLLHDIGTVGELTGAQAEASALVAQLRSTADRVQQAVSAEASVSCFVEISPPPSLFTVGPGSFVFDLLQRAGCEPVTKGATNPYPEWSVEQIVKDDPEVYLVTTEAGVGVKDVEVRPGYADLSAVRNHRVVLVDADIVSRPGPRVGQALQVLAEALHPEVAG